MSTLKTNEIQTVSGKVLLRSSGGIVNVTQLLNTTQSAVSNAANGVLWSTSVNKLYDSSSTNLVVHAQLNGRVQSSGNCGTYLEIAGIRNYNFVHEYNDWTSSEMPIWGMGTWSGLNAGSNSIIAGWSTANGSASDRPFTTFNPDQGSSDARARKTQSTIIIYEVVI